MPESEPQSSASAPSQRSDWVALGRQHAAAHEQRRQQARERIHGWVLHPIDTPHLLGDPLAHRVPRLSTALIVARLGAIAVALHALMLLVAFGASKLIGGQTVYRAPERVQLRIVQPPPPPAPEPEPVAELAPEFEQTPQPEPPQPRTPPPAAKEAPKLPPTAAEPVAAEPPPEPAAEPPRRRVVGLSLESTVVGGEGPGFAVGTTRMGSTEQRAVDPKQASTATASRGEGTGSGGAAPKRNRGATQLPTADAPSVKPRRVAAPEPDYPPLLRQQGIEGDVVLLATIDERGQVSDVKVVRPSPHPEFNEAALAAARRARYTAATRGGKPLVFSQRYTVRFRIHD